MRFLKVLLAVMLVMGGLLVGVWRGWLSLPAAWNPWAPLDVRATPNLLTRFKLIRDRKSVV